MVHMDDCGELSQCAITVVCRPRSYVAPFLTNSSIVFSVCGIHCRKYVALGIRFQ